MGEGRKGRREKKGFRRRAARGERGGDIPKGAKPNLVRWREIGKKGTDDNQSK